MTKPMPLSGGIAFRKAVATSSPPADMPMPTIGNAPPTPSAASLPKDWGVVCRSGAGAPLTEGRRRLGAGLPEPSPALDSLLLKEWPGFCRSNAQKPSLALCRSHFLTGRLNFFLI